MEFKKRFAAASLLAISAVACSTSGERKWQDLSNVPPIPAVPVRDQRIVPGRRVGPAYLGMTAAQLYAAMGNPSETTRFRNDNITYYKYSGMVAIIADTTQRVHQIDVLSREYVTPEGVHMGDADLAARAAYPAAKWEASRRASVYFCDHRGMGITLENGNVSYIRVVAAPSC